MEAILNIKIPNGLDKPQPRVSFDTFLELYNDRTDGFKYEWNEGVVEKSSAMTTKELFMIDLLTRLFVKTAAFETGGLLTSEIEQWVTSSKYRRPDLAYFTKAQIREGRKGNEPVSEFMLEVISEFDQINKVNDKVLEYFAAGVKVVWLIFPQQQMVQVYTSPEDVKICKGDKICSAAPVISDFCIAASDIFKEED